MEVKEVDNNKIYTVTRKELKELKNLNNKDVVKAGKYYIHIVYDKYKYASMESYVNTEENLNDLSIYKQPQYIRDFLENLESE